MYKYLYKITCLVNGKVYIGQSIDPARRFSSHLSKANTNADRSPLHDAIAHYGKENFVLDVLEYTEDYNNREKELIKEYNSLIPYGYNLSEGGDDPPRKYGEEHPNSVISDEDAKRIIYELKRGELTQTEICNLFNPPLNQVMINSINMGVTHVQPVLCYPIRMLSPYHLNNRQIDEIRWILANSICPMSEIAKYYNVNTSAIKAINTGRNYYDNTIDYPIRKFRGSKYSEPVEAILQKRSTEAIDTPKEMVVYAR